MAWGMGAMAQQVCVVLSATQREQLSAIAADRNRPRKRHLLCGTASYPSPVGGSSPSLRSARGSCLYFAGKSDYKRHGTTTLFAALSVLDGTVIGRCMQRHRHIEFIRFLNAVERQVPAGKLIHTVLDNYATHKHPKVLAWLARHPRWIFHFTPTSASWLNAVENFFSKMTRQRIRRGVFRSIADLQAAINVYLAEHNVSPKPFVWTQSAEAILAKLDRCPAASV
ncbi:MAG: IS630 family transposase [Stellaceae bacterium]